MHKHAVHNDECSHNDMQDLACGLFSMIYDGIANSLLHVEV